MYRTLFLLILSIFLSSIGFAQSPVILIRQMVDSAAVLQGFTAEITKEERIEGKLIKQVSAVKLMKEPYNLYLNQRFPKEGVEVLVRGKEDKPLVNPNAFPWFNLNLDPYGSLMRKNQHHTVYDSGFDLLVNTLESELEKMGKDTSKHIHYVGKVDWEGRMAYEVEVVYEDYGKRLYRIQLGEDLNSIAKKLNVNEYSILELNKEIDFYDDVEPGQEIQVPSSYAKKMVLLIDADYMLPLVTRVYDDKGLYEHYAYKNFVLNPVFKETEFLSEYNEYGF